MATDVTVIFDVEPVWHDNYKSWEEGQTLAGVFEMRLKALKSKISYSKNALRSP